jgi:hypothetical protein
MKLRIKGNSIRFRLGRSEVCRLASDGMIEEFTDFGPSSAQRFRYELHATFTESEVLATFINGRVVVSVPADTIHHWARTNQIGIDARQRLGDGSELRILIEKDFACIDGSPDGSQEDAFPNPQLQGACTTTTTTKSD